MSNEKSCKTPAKSKVPSDDAPVVPSSSSSSSSLLSPSCSSINDASVHKYLKKESCIPSDVSQLVFQLIGEFPQAVGVLWLTPSQLTDRLITAGVDATFRVEMLMHSFKYHNRTHLFESREHHKKTAHTALQDDTIGTANMPSSPALRQRISSLADLDKTAKISGVRSEGGMDGVGITIHQLHVNKLSCRVFPVSGLVFRILR